MRATTSLVVGVAALAAPLLGQTIEQNRFGMWDRTSEFSSRGALGPGGGQVSQKHPWGVVGGLLSTQESFDVGVTGTLPSGYPDYANTKFYATKLRMPSQQGIRAWTVTHNLNTSSNAPVTLPQDGTGFHHCWRLPSGASWPTDGLSVHMSPGPWTLLYAWKCANMQHAEMQRYETGRLNVYNYEELAWSDTPSAGPVYQPLAWELEVGTPQAVLEGGAANATFNCPGVGNPNRGYASLDPDFVDYFQRLGRYDDYTWFVEAGASHAWGLAVLFHSRVLGTPFAIPGVRGTFLLDVTDPLFAVTHVILLGATGSGSFTLNLGPPTSSARRLVAGLPTWASQAVVFSPKPAPPSLELTNVFTMRVRTLDQLQFKSGFAAKGSPLTILRKTGDRTLYIRNDGHGTALVQQYAGQTLLPGASAVFDRAAVRIPLSPGATRVVVSSTSTVSNRWGSGIRILYAMNY